MRPQSLVFWGVIALLFVYTGYKAGQMWPTSRLVAWARAILFFALIIGWQFLYRAEPVVLDSVWFVALSWVGSIGLGLWATFILLSAPLDVVRAVAAAARRLGRRAQLNRERRSFLARWIPLGVLTASGGIASVGFVQAMRGPQVNEIEVPIPGLPKALHGLTIAQISDLHVGPTIQHGYVDEVVRQTNALQPDLIAVTGDLADGAPAILEPHLAALADLKARLGSYYVTGNHEYYWGVERWLEKARALGLVPLLNENRVIAVQDAKILLAGITDSGGGNFVASHRPDQKRAVQSTEDCQLKVLLAHRPDHWLEAERLGFHLQLSGHTHGGQFFPWSVLMPIAYRYYRGLNRHERMWIFVSSGTGYWGPAHRFAIPSEIALLRLTAA
jgi:hypothetical protein